MENEEIKVLKCDEGRRIERSKGKTQAALESGVRFVLTPLNLSEPH